MTDKFSAGDLVIIPEGTMFFQGSNWPAPRLNYTKKPEIGIFVQELGSLNNRILFFGSARGMFTACGRIYKYEPNKRRKN